jgi:hypothetical protein
MAALGTDRGWAEKVRMTVYSTFWRDLAADSLYLKKLPIADPTFWCADGGLWCQLHGETPVLQGALRGGDVDVAVQPVLDQPAGD